MTEHEIRKLICVVCPNGCRLHTVITGDEINVTGNKCNRGIDFAIAEITNPTRTVTTTVRTVFSGAPVLPVRTAGEIPKGKIPELIRLLGDITLTKPVGIGGIVAENVLGLGVNVVATSNLLGNCQGER
jgi:CxxC motif-containing protein